MTHSAWTRARQPVNAADYASSDWEALKLCTQLGDFILPCCEAPAVLKTSIRGVPFFAHLTDECATAPETKWHKAGKTTVLAALRGLGIEGWDEAPGQTAAGDKWKADVLFSHNGRTIAIELQRSYQHLRDFTRRQERYKASGVECYWLVRLETFRTLVKATGPLLLKRDYGNKWPEEGIGTGSLPELPVAMLDTDSEGHVDFGGMQSATVPAWLDGILNGSYQYRQGSWNLN
ncbi:competence protein CoiA family protein [Janthinobacterium sp. LS2A]